MKTFLSGIDWSVVSIVFLTVLFICSIVGLSFLGRIMLVPCIGRFWTVIILIPVYTAVLLGFLEIYVRH